MGKYKTFEDLRVWQEARELTDVVYGASGKGELGRDFILRDQMRRSSISIMSNIARGQEQGGNSNMRDSLTIAKGAVGAFVSHLYVAEDAGYLDSETLDDLKNRAEKLRRGVGGFIGYLWKQQQERNGEQAEGAEVAVHEEESFYGITAAS